MGQQQLLVIVLVAIIVGIATIIAINTFGSNMENKNRDAVQEDLLRAASAAQGVWHRIESLGGAGQDFENSMTPKLLMERLHFSGTIDPDAPIVTNENAVYVLSDIEANGFTLTATPALWPFDIILVLERDTDTGSWIYELSSGDD
ncbi:hypothetical protein QLX67_10065 [Balneolaceae bacterium ANBcel3]|nr:hypothetical protein [Balneolaceae bacterium ANBcel3]